ncbi:MAG: hypothetical protein MUC87_11405 [Bacteroidia bacterium]|jgi:hypothetical protein|nr:hypothetical protein [Bacteroidia bacterium]
MNSYFRFSEYMWLVLAIICAGLTAWFFITKQTDNGYFAVGMAVLAGVMYGLRRRFNKSQSRQKP